MRIDILTIFPEMFKGPLTCSLLAKAREKKILNISYSDIRSFTKDKHNMVDDRPFGGGPGMVMKPEPIYLALKSLGVKKKNCLYKKPLKKPYVIYMSPQGQTLNTQKVKKLSQYEHLVLLCGHYEGIDERVMSWIDEEISIGDYVLTGGEIPAMVLIDSVARMLSGVVQDKSSVEQDSFYNGMLDYPHYTRPAKFRNMEVPDVLLSGNHLEIEKWRKQQSYDRTKSRRPDLLKK
ncbi:MAG: tRNA (guanosine(37)-N1)-methyltransferase TrmD [Endomicrobiaceae bacterium]|nr:tRNA (guanosine(37)-N1)-methyltransferase TrmD [Endomicrobiaceae bacterium]